VTSFTLQLAANLDQRLALTNRTNSQPVSTFTASGFYPFFLTGLLFAHFEPLRVTTSHSVLTWSWWCAETQHIASFNLLRSNPKLGAKPSDIIAASHDDHNIADSKSICRIRIESQLTCRLSHGND
jgi:hypothetical protein